MMKFGHEEERAVPEENEEREDWAEVDGREEWWEKRKCCGMTLCLDDESLDMMDKGRL